jgi:hypothetical protein
MLSVACFVLTIAAPIGIAHSTREEEEEARAFYRNSTIVNGVVTRLWRASGDSRPPWAAYSFEVDGRSYSSQARARLSVWRTLHVGSSLPIRFRIDDPQQNRPDGWGRTPMPWWFGIFVGAALLAVGLVTTIPLRRQRHLLSEGRVSQGIVSRHTKGDKGTMIEYEFKVLSGASAKGRSGPSRKPLAIGTNIVVLYDSEVPARNALYPLPLVKLRR